MTIKVDTTLRLSLDVERRLRNLHVLKWSLHSTLISLFSKSKKKSKLEGEKPIKMTHIRRKRDAHPNAR